MTGPRVRPAPSSAPCEAQAQVNGGRGDGHRYIGRHGSDAAFPVGMSRAGVLIASQSLMECSRPAGRGLAHGEHHDPQSR